MNFFTGALILLNLSLAFGHPNIMGSERKAVEEWSSLEQGKGLLLTPVSGKIESQVIAVRDYLRNIVVELSGQRLKEKKINWVLNIYANESPNAWVQQFVANDGPEAAWDKADPTTMWPVRRLLGFGDNKEPIYELGITTGLLKLLKYQDELAFVFGHELTHLLEGHTDHDREAYRKWWSSQAHEVVADAQGIDKILGRYDLDGALLALTRLMALSKDQMSKSDILEALQNGAAAHHHEGVRISESQFYIEYLRRTDKRAAPKKMIEIPETMKLIFVSREAKLNQRSNKESEKILNELLDDYYLKGKTYEYLFAEEESVSSRLYRTKGPKQNKLEDLSIRYSTKEELAAIVHRATKKIDASSVTDSVKINAFLQFVLSMTVKFNYDQFEMWDGLDATQFRDIAGFLLKYGKRGWRFDDFMHIIKKLRRQQEPHLEKMFFDSKGGQKMLAFVSKHSTEWSRFYSDFHSIKGYFDDGMNLNSLYYKIDYLVDQIIPGELKEDLLAKMLKELDGLKEPQYEKLYSSKWNEGYTLYSLFISKFSTISENEGKKGDYAFGKKVAQILLEKDGRKKKYLDKLLKDLPQIFSERHSMVEKFQGIMSLEEMIRSVPLDSEQKTYLAKQILKVISDFSKETNKDLETGIFQVRGAILDLLVEVFTKGQFSKQDKINVIKFFGFYFTAYMDFDFGKDRTPLIDSMREFSESLTKGELMSLILDEIPSMKGLIKILNDNKDEKFTLERAKKIDKSLEANGFTPKEYIKVARTFEEAHGRITNALRILIKNKLEHGLLQFNAEDLNRIFAQLEMYHEQNSHLRLSRDKAHQINHSAAQALYLIFLHVHKGIKNFDQWFQMYSRLRAITGDAYSMSKEADDEIREYLKAQLNKESPKEIYERLKLDSIKNALKPRDLADYASRYASTLVNDKSTNKSIQQEIEVINKTLKLQDSFQEAYVLFRTEMTEKLKLQPESVDIIFPNSTKTVTEMATGLSSEIRGLSAVAGMIRSRSTVEQIQFIEYLMGRQTAEPLFLNQLEEDFRGRLGPTPVSILQQIRKLKADLANRNPLERSFVVNSILAGPNSILENAEGLKLLSEHILKPVKSENREVAEIMLDSLVRAEGHNKSFIFSYVLSQATNSGSAFNETIIIKSLLDAYGAPGVKLAQYLAFSGEFKNFSEALESYQDAAMPISYYEALKLVQSRFGSDWDPSKYRINKMLGSGSVNIAIEVENLSTGQTEVFSILRKDIETKTTEDFRRFKLFIQALTESKDPERFNFILGLIDIIERSVTLEFAKENAFEIQKGVQSLYRRQMDGWNVQTVDAFEYKNGTIIMEKAPGRGARKILAEQPDVYKTALRALAKIEYGVLRGVGEKNNIVPVRLIANPDLHDGQVLIDVEKKLVTFLDFGQALPISNLEREFGIEILRAISKADRVGETAKLIEYQIKRLGKRDVVLDLRELSKILSKNDRMDIFVHLISFVGRSGYEIPLSTIHWVLAANRLIKLGEKVGYPIEKQFRNLVITHKVGLSTNFYNAAKLAWDKVEGLLSQPYSIPQCKNIL